MNKTQIFEIFAENIQKFTLFTENYSVLFCLNLIYSKYLMTPISISNVPSDSSYQTKFNNIYIKCFQASSFDNVKKSP